MARFLKFRSSPGSVVVVNVEAIETVRQVVDPGGGAALQVQLTSGERVSVDCGFDEFAEILQANELSL